MSDAQDRGRKVFFAIFTISGFSGLIYESIWSHYLKLFLGHAAYAQTLVLAIFMGGMAVGSWVIARRSARIVNLLIGYAIVEGIIGLFGLLFHKTSVLITSWAFDVLLPSVGSPLIAQLSKWLIGSLLMLPQSILLGMTFPLMSGAIVRRYPQRSGETLAMLYFTNSLGAAIGVLVSGFYLIGAVGLPGTIMTAGLLNVALALTVWTIVKYQPATVRPPATESPAGESTQLPLLVRWILVGAAITGVAAFLYEIAWIRMLSLVLGSSTHSFELMLSAFILGIALGGLWVHRRIDGLKDPIRFLGGILVTMALVALISLPIYNATFDLMAYVYWMFSRNGPGYIGFNVASHVIAMLLMIPTTFFCGMTLPVMTNVLIRGGSGERAIGAVYAWNTAGAIVGVLLAVHWLMPIVGIKGIVVTGAVLHFALGVAYLSRSSLSRPGFRLARVPIVVAVIAVVCVGALVQLDPSKLSSGVFRHGFARQEPTSKVLYLQHGKTATVTLVDVESRGQITIATNGKPDASIMMRGSESGSDEITMVMAGAIPIALHTHPQRVANIGIGSGLTSHVLLASPVVTSVDTVEIEPYMAKAAKLGFMPRVSRTFTDPRSHIYFEDAKTFFAINQNRYDVIVSEPSNPWVSGVATLFSEEFYRQITRYLEPDGMLVQWMQIYETDISIVLSVIKALAPQFADFAIYNTDDSNLLIVASKAGQIPAPDTRVFDAPAMRDELARVGIESLQDFEGRFLGNKRMLLPLIRASGVPANSDYFPFVDLNAARARITERNAIQWPGLNLLPLPFFELLNGTANARAQTSFRPRGVAARDDQIGRASALRRAIETSRYDELSPQAARTLLTLQSPKNECQKLGVQRAWLDSAYYVAAQTNAVLMAQELGPMWDLIAATPCASALSPPDKQLLALLRAVAVRDVPAVAAQGKALLASDYAFSSPAEQTMAVIATLASQVATNQKEDAIALISQRRLSAAPDSAESFALSWLSAMAVEPSTGGSQLHAQ
jgi:predicted membrane-bound spermidine synthase